MNKSLDSQPLERPLAVGSTVLLTAAVLPHAAHLYTPVIFFFLVGAGLRLAATAYPWLARRGMIILLAVCGFTVTTWHYGAPLGRDPGISFLLILCGLKVLETPTRRDARIALTLGYFIIVTHFLYFVGFWVVVYLFGVVLGITWQLIRLTRAQPYGQFGVDSRLALKMTLQAVPFALVMFFLFPRFAGSLWLLQLPQNRSVTGMSEELTLGSLSNLVGSRATAFTANFYSDNIPPPELRYWRASVLWDYNDLTWRRGNALANTPTRLTQRGAQYRYEIEPVSSRDRFLYALDLPTSTSALGTISPDFILERPRPLKSLPRYEVISNAQYANLTIGPEQQSRGIALPPNTISPRMRRLLLELGWNGGSAAGSHDALARNILQYIRAEEFVYTLRPTALLSTNPIDEFLFSTRQGFCEHYASSFVTLMRAAGIPARLVIGYLGGELNPRANLITVRQEDAHAWAEYWSNTHGWVRVDPTAAIAPERIENGIDFTLSLTEAGRVQYQPDELGIFGNLMQEAGWYSQLARRQWNRWFVGYDRTRQQSLLRGLGLNDWSLEKVAVLAFGVAITLLLAVFTFILWRGRIKSDPAVMLYNRYCRKLAAKGLHRHPHEGPLDYYARCAKRFGERRDQLQEITQLYLDIRYGHAPGNAALKRLNKRIRALKV